LLSRVHSRGHISPNVVANLFYVFDVSIISKSYRKLKLQDF